MVVLYAQIIIIDIVEYTMHTNICLVILLVSKQKKTVSFSLLIHIDIRKTMEWNINFAKIGFSDTYYLCYIQFVRCLILIQLMSRT